MQPIELKRSEARKLALVNQGLNRSDLPRGQKGISQALRQIGYVQIDTISVVERAHHHTLWNRVPHYRHRLLDRLIETRDLIEYWSHAAAYLPIEHFRFCLPRMNALASGQRHWYPRNPKIMKRVLDRIRVDGPLQARDFTEHKGPTGMWEWGPVKQAIEQLFMEGELMVTRRDSFQKVFDLTERVIPGDINTHCPNELELAGFLIDRQLRAGGIGRKPEFSYLQRGMGPVVQQAIEHKLEAGDILPAGIAGLGNDFFVSKDYESALQQRLSRRRVRLLSPFDNVVIQRDRLQRLFGFDYQLECYVPAAKRQYGYFCLPILWLDQLYGRLDAKADRKTGVFTVRLLNLERRVPQFDGFIEALKTELARFAAHCQCTDIVFRQVIPADLKRQIVQKG